MIKTQFVAATKRIFVLFFMVGISVSTIAQQHPKLITPDCGRVGVKGNDLLRSEQVNGAVRYEFKVENATDVFSEVVVKNDRNFTLNELPSELNGNTEYAVKIRADKGNGWEPWGDICKIKTLALLEPNVLPAYCGNFEISANDIIKIKPIAHAEKYEIVVDIENLGSDTLITTTNEFKIADLKTLSFQSSEVYKIKVRAMSGNIFSNFGSVCFLETAYQDFCGTEYDLEEEEITGLKSSTEDNIIVEIFPENIYHIPLQVINAKYSNGTGVSDDRIDYALAIVNAQFEPYNIKFFECSERIVIHDDILTNSEKDAMISRSLELIPNLKEISAVRVFFVNNIQDALGFADVHGNNILYIDSKAMPDITNYYNVLAHEFGHALNLLHTHHRILAASCTRITTELVNGSNCSTAGDLICDTPADPGGYKVCWPQTIETPHCIYKTDIAITDFSLVDENGEPYAPDISNYMSYAPNQCRNSFSPQQVMKMKANAISKNYDGDIDVVLDFDNTDPNQVVMLRTRNVVPLTIRVDKENVQNELEQVFTYTQSTFPTPYECLFPLEMLICITLAKSTL
jgi:hypothetical protein